MLKVYRVGLDRYLLFRSLKLAKEEIKNFKLNLTTLLSLIAKSEERSRGRKYIEIYSSSYY